MGQVTTVTKVTVVTVRALIVGPMVGRCRDRIIPNTTHHPLFSSSNMVSLTLRLPVGSSTVTLHLLRLVQLQTVITVGNTVRTALLLLSTVSLVITMHSMVREGVLWGLQGVAPTGQVHLSGTLKLPRGLMGCTLTLVTMGASHHPFRFSHRVDSGMCCMVLGSARYGRCSAKLILNVLALATASLYLCLRPALQIVCVFVPYRGTGSQLL